MQEFNFGGEFDGSEEELDKKLDEFLADIKARIKEDILRRAREGGGSIQNISGGLAGSVSYGREGHNEDGEYLCLCPSCRAEINYENFEDKFKDLDGKITSTSFTIEDETFDVKYYKDGIIDHMVCQKRRGDLSVEDKISHLTKQMERAASQDNFELAAKLNKQIKELTKKGE